MTEVRDVASRGGWKSDMASRIVGRSDSLDSDRSFHARPSLATRLTPQHPNPSPQGTGDMSQATSMAGSLIGALNGATSQPLAASNDNATGQPTGGARFSSTEAVELRGQVMSFVSNTAASALQDPQLILQATAVVASVVDGPCDSDTLDGAAGVLTSMVSGAGNVGLDDGVAQAALQGIGSILGQAGTHTSCA